MTITIVNSKTQIHPFPGDTEIRQLITKDLKLKSRIKKLTKTLAFGQVLLPITKDGLFEKYDTYTAYLLSLEDLNKLGIKYE